MRQDEEMIDWSPMASDTDEAMRIRVDVLERRNLRLSWAFGTTSVMVVVGVLLLCAEIVEAAAQTPAIATKASEVSPETLRVKAVEVVDDQGRVLVVLGANDYGDGIIQTFSSLGDEAVRITNTVDGEGKVRTFDER